MTERRSAPASPRGKKEIVSFSYDVVFFDRDKDRDFFAKHFIFLSFWLKMAGLKPIGRARLHSACTSFPYYRQFIKKKRLTCRKGKSTD